MQRYHLLHSHHCNQSHHRQKTAPRWLEEITRELAKIIRYHPKGFSPANITHISQVETEELGKL